jgi:hypothetical protein
MCFKKYVVSTLYFSCLDAIDCICTSVAATDRRRGQRVVAARSGRAVAAQREAMNGGTESDKEPKERQRRE